MRVCRSCVLAVAHPVTAGKEWRSNSDLYYSKFLPELLRPGHRAASAADGAELVRLWRAAQAEMGWADDIIGGPLDPADMAQLCRALHMAWAVGVQGLVKSHMVDGGAGAHHNRLPSTHASTDFSAHCSCSCSARVAGTAGLHV